jgi:hypothetical protein
MAYGDIVGFLDSELIDGYMSAATIIPLDGGRFAIFYQGTDHDGWVKVLSVDAAGVFTLIDSWEFDAGYAIMGQDGRCALTVNADIRAVFYRDAGNANRVRTFSVTDAGVITKSTISTAAADSGLNQFRNAVKKAGTNVHVCVYQKVWDTVIRTWTINDDGTGVSTADSWMFISPGTYTGAYIQHISGDIFAVAYSDGSNRYLKTFSIDDSGNITKSFIDSIYLRGHTSYTEHIHHVAGTVFALFFNGSNAVRTYNIADDGTITHIASDTFGTYGAGSLGINKAFYLAGQHVFFCNIRKSGWEGRLTTKVINSDGSIGSKLDEVAYGGTIVQYVFDPGWSSYATIHIVPWSTTPGVDGYVHSWEIEGSFDVHTYDPLVIGRTTAEGYGYSEFESADGGLIDQIGFEWGTSTGVYTDDNIAAFDSEYGDFNKEMTGLLPNTTYYYRAAVHHVDFGWQYGEEVSFTTLPNVPDVDTLNPSCPVSNQVTANGEITNIGTGNPDVRGFVWDTISHGNPGPTVSPVASAYTNYTEETGSFGVGPFSAVLSPMVEQQEYYIRAYAHNADGYFYGSEVMLFYSTTLNLLMPDGPGDETNIRFEVPRGASHWSVVRKDDSSFYMPPTGWGFGGITGRYVLEKQHYAPRFSRDLYSLSNSCRRDEGVIKIKWKAHLVENTYPYSKYRRAIKTGGVVYESPDRIVAGTDEYVCEVFYNNPNTGNPWTISELDSLQAGANLYGGSGFGRMALDQVCVCVLWVNAEVRSDAATRTAPDTALLEGTVIEDEAEPCQVYFEWGETTAYGNTTSLQTKAEGESFTADISGLDPANTYHARAVLVTECGETFYGDDLGIAVLGGGGHRADLLVKNGFI